MSSAKNDSMIVTVFRDLCDDLFTGETDQRLTDLEERVKKIGSSPKSVGKF